MHPDLEFRDFEETTGFEVFIGLEEELLPVFDGAGERAEVDECEGFVAPGVFDIVDFEFQVWRYPLRAYVREFGVGEGRVVW